MLTDPFFWAVVIFFVVPLALVAWTAWLIFGGMAKYEDLQQPMGDATETPRVLSILRQINWRR